MHIQLGRNVSFGKQLLVIILAIADSKLFTFYAKLTNEILRLFLILFRLLRISKISVISTSMKMHVV